MAKTIEKKTYSSLFKQVANGAKTYEFRLADWYCQPGDTLVLVEIDDKTRVPTGKTLRRKVGFVGKIKEIDYWTPEEIEKYGYQIISLIDAGK